MEESSGLCSTEYVCLVGSTSDMMQECGDGKDNHVACYCPAGTRILHPQHFQILLLSSLITVSLATDNRFSSHIISSLIIASL